MQTATTPSVEISIALLSWINDQLRESVEENEERRVIRHAFWIQQAVTVLSISLTGLCVIVLQRWT